MSSTYKDFNSVDFSFLTITRGFNALEIIICKLFKTDSVFIHIFKNSHC